MILLADSGSTKTDWALLPCTVDEGEAACFQTQGINPVLMDDAAIVTLLKEQLCPYLTDRDITSLFFYGAGCRPEQVAKMQGALTAACFNAATPPPPIHIHSDMLGAARALCQHSEGIACILGTGANSCLYDGSNIVDNRPALGFILGDEGSGAVLGKRFVNALYEGRMPADMLAGFEQATGLTLPRLIDRVYRQPMPNRFLASLAPFIHQQLHREEVRLLVTENFRDFLHNNILRYGRNDLPVNAVGSIAYHFAPQLHEAAGAEGVHIGNIIKSPMEGLMDYHRATAI